MSIRLVSLLLIHIAFAPSLASAQAVYGSISGVITDASGGVVPGATVTVTTAGRGQARAASSQSSYYSHDDLRLHFGLDSAVRADTIEVRWPSGHVDTIRDVAGDRVVTIQEGSGVAKR